MNDEAIKTDDEDAVEIKTTDYSLFIISTLMLCLFKPEFIFSIITFFGLPGLICSSICFTIYKSLPYLIKLQKNHQKELIAKRNHEMKMLEKSIE